MHSYIYWCVYAIAAERKPFFMWNRVGYRAAGGGCVGEVYDWDVQFL